MKKIKKTKSVKDTNITRLKRRANAYNTNLKKAEKIGNFARVKELDRKRVETLQELRGMEELGIEGLSEAWKKAGSKETSTMYKYNGMDYKKVEVGGHTLLIRNGKAYLFNPLTGEMNESRYVGY